LQFNGSAVELAVCLALRQNMELKLWRVTRNLAINSNGQPPPLPRSYDVGETT
jgi:hypothetical protein